MEEHNNSNQNEEQKVCDCNENCNCGVECQCGDGLSCGEACTCRTLENNNQANKDTDNNNSTCDCNQGCSCGDNCSCDKTCECENCGVVQKAEVGVEVSTPPAPNFDKGHRPLEKVMIICSKAGVDSVYAALILANGARSEGIECDMFFTFFGLDTITKKRMEHLKVAIAGNPGMHMPEMVGVLPGMEAFATNMMRKEMEKLDIPGVGEFLEIIKAAGGNIFGCKLAAEMFHLTREDMWEGVDDIITVGQFYERVTERSQIIFV